MEYRFKVLLKNEQSQYFTLQHFCYKDALVAFADIVCDIASEIKDFGRNYRCDSQYRKFKEREVFLAFVRRIAG